MAEQHRIQTAITQLFAIEHPIILAGMNVAAGAFAPVAFHLYCRSDASLFFLYGEPAAFY